MNKPNPSEFRTWRLADGLTRPRTLAQLAARNLTNAIIENLPVLTHDQAEDMLTFIAQFRDLHTP